MLSDRAAAGAASWIILPVAQIKSSKRKAGFQEGMSQVEEVRAAADIVKIVGDYVKLRKAGANYMGLCPFHQEKTPSFAVHPAKQIFHCFGCGVGGDAFKSVMLMNSLSFP